eukprot:CAMPEP_0172421082 /NCGR_PEP_ID=MMETSP1064-20121228/7365_1 /TAXON_ID=202472 /ORGANISM="Aulacoseira subarctica , Strain CCAP 1002/5" /LENGTH=507 /DNA_ID=CAMNT_0013161307 /DNA_START=112 /DNA_END=1635 /DNA_ORIENTATION=+
MERIPLLLRANSNNGDMSESSSSVESKREEEPPSNHNTASLILSLAIPALVGEIIDPLLTLADTAFVGRFAGDNNNAAALLAGLGSASAILTFSFYLFNFLCTATTPLISQRRAAGNDTQALTLSGQVLTLALLLGCLVTLILTVFSQPLLTLMGTSQTGPQANQYATSFLAIRAFAAPAVFLNSASTGILRGFLDTKTSTIILLAANVINFTLDVLLIPVAHLIPTTGAAIATTTAEWIAALSFLGVLAGKLPSAEGNLGWNLKEQPPSNVVIPALTIPAFQDVKPLLVASSSLFIRSACLQLFISGAAATAARAGVGGDLASTSAASVAAHQIALQLWVLCSFICDALAAAAQALISDAIGRQDLTALKDLTRTMLSYAAILGVTLAIILQIGNLSGFLLSFFTTNMPTQKALVPLLDILILSQPLNAIVFTADGVLQGASQFTYQAKSMLLSVGIAIAFFFALQQSAVGNESSTLVNVWQAFVVLQTMRLLTSFAKMSQIIPIR